MEVINHLSLLFRSKCVKKIHIRNSSNDAEPVIALTVWEQFKQVVFTVLLHKNKEVGGALTLTHYEKFSKSTKHQKITFTCCRVIPKNLNKKFNYILCMTETISS